MSLLNLCATCYSANFIFQIIQHIVDPKPKMRQYDCFDGNVIKKRRKLNVTDILESYPSLETGKKICFMNSLQGKAPSYF